MKKKVQRPSPSVNAASPVIPSVDMPEAEVDVHVITMAHFERALRAFNEKLEEIDLAPHPLAKEWKETSVDLRKAMQAVLDERKFARGSQDKNGLGGDAGDELDLDDVRANLLTRLARMRDTD